MSKLKPLSYLLVLAWLAFPTLIIAQSAEVYPFVHQISFTDQRCSAVQISPRVLLTAGYCISPEEEVMIGEKAYPFEASFTPHSTDQWAALILSQDLGRLQTYPCIGNKIDLGEVFRFVGYGVGDGKTSFHVGTNRVRGLDESSFWTKNGGDHLSFGDSGAPALREGSLALIGLGYMAGYRGFNQSWFSNLTTQSAFEFLKEVETTSGDSFCFEN